MQHEQPRFSRRTALKGAPGLLLGPSLRAAVHSAADGPVGAGPGLGAPVLVSVAAGVFPAACGVVLDEQPASMAPTASVASPATTLRMIPPPARPHAAHREDATPELTGHQRSV